MNKFDLSESITIGEIKDIVDHLHNDPVSTQTDKYLTDSQMNKYLKRMVPYSQMQNNKKFLPVQNLIILDTTI